MSNKIFLLCSILENVFSGKARFNIEHVYGGGGNTMWIGSLSECLPTVGIYGEKVISFLRKDEAILFVFVILR